MTDSLSEHEKQRLIDRLARLEGQRRWITSKPTLSTIMREAAEIKWRLGLISDDEFAELEDFDEDFDFGT